MDSDELANAEKLRGQLLIEQAARLAQLRKDLDDAVVFNTRGGFERVVSGVSELLDLYGEQNVEDLAGTQGLRGKAQERLITFDRAGHKVQRARLTMLADAFGAEKPTLRKIVTDYIVKYLPMEPGEQPDENDEGSGDGK